MTLYRSWLPADAIARGLRDLPLRAAVRGWSAKWFAQGGADVSGDHGHVAPRDLESGIAWSLDDGLMLVVDDDTPLAVAALMFGAPPEADAPTAADRAALEDAAGTCLADLRARLGEAVGLHQPWRPVTGNAAPHAWWKFRVATGARAMLWIVVSEALVARCVRAGLPPAPSRAAPRSLDAALDVQSVGVSARVGAARLTTSEVAALGVGDLLVLDTALADPARIAVNHRPQPLGCTIDQHDERLRLVVL